jgi:hypothetical protein
MNALVRPDTSILTMPSQFSMLVLLLAQMLLPSLKELMGSRLILFL